MTSSGSQQYAATVIIKPLTAAAKPALAVTARIASPPDIPMPKVIRVLPIAKGSPGNPSVTVNISRSVIGEDDQKAIIRAKGTPPRGSPEMLGKPQSWKPP